MTHALPNRNMRGTPLSRQAREADLRSGTGRSTPPALLEMPGKNSEERMRAIFTAFAGCPARVAATPARSLLCGAAFLSAVLAGPAAAQDDGGPLRFMRPAIEGQQPGEAPPPPESSTVEAPDASPDDSVEATPSDPVAAEDDEAPAESAAGPEPAPDAAEAEDTEPPAAPVVPPLAGEPAEEQPEGG